VAPADLLDILSKGSNPQLILRHLSKCFDNVHNLSFRKDDRGEPTKVGSTVQAQYIGCSGFWQLPFLHARLSAGATAWC
jgi:hypothetical protein